MDTRMPVARDCNRAVTIASGAFARRILLKGTGWVECGSSKRDCSVRGSKNLIS